MANMALGFGKGTLLGFAFLFVWLVLLHVLVNIWLLCAFTSFVVALGGWFGLQAALDSSSVVHLERFVTLDQVPPSFENDLQLDQELQNTVRKIIRDFVTSWYSSMSASSGFEIEVQDVMTSMAMELKLRARQVDRKMLTHRVLDLCGCHLQTFLKAKEMLAEQKRAPQEKTSNETDMLWKFYSKVDTPHPALKSAAIEVNYARMIIHLLLHVVVPPPHLETCIGRFVVGEIITCNVLLPLIAKFSDPDWLNIMIVSIFTNSSKQEKSVAAESLASPLPSQPVLPEHPPQEGRKMWLSNNADALSGPLALHIQPETSNTMETVTPELGSYDVVDSGEVYCPQSSTVKAEPSQTFVIHYDRPGKSNQENNSDLDSPLIRYKIGSLDDIVIIDQDDGLSDRCKECATPTENSSTMDDHEDGVFCGHEDITCPKVLVNSEPLVQCDNSGTFGTPKTASFNNFSDQERESSSTSANPGKELALGVDQAGLSNSNELLVVSPLPESAAMASFSFEHLSSPEGPIIIQNLRITGTITAKEHRGTGSHPYTLYTIKYETAVGCENPGSFQPGSDDTGIAQQGTENPASAQEVAYHMVNRRYSEFLNLQARLEEKSELRKILKGVKGPKKIFPDMPFGNMDTDRIEARKGLLETFLKQLCAIPETANSEEMQEFLALNTDARIAFVKKPFIVSRIDKIVVNAIVDTLKTAFPRSEPQSPTEDNDTEVDTVKLPGKKNKSLLKVSSKNTRSRTVFNGMSIDELEAFTIKQVRKANTPVVPEKGDNPAVEEPRGCGNQGSCPKGTQTQDLAVPETELADVALNILCLLMKDQWSYLCTENIQKAIRLLFGTLINRWLDVSVAKLTCIQYWVAYLRVIQEAVWPGGSLPVGPQPERSQQQKDDTKQKALSCLMSLVPDLIIDILGSDKYKVSWQTALDSLQNPYINRHLAYCICDLFLEFLVPEIPEEDFQKSLIQSFS